MLMKDELFEAQLLRAIGYAPYGAADAGECLAAASRIGGVDLERWHDEWRSLGERLFVLARRSEARGDREGARSAYFRASNYFRTCGLFALRAPVPPQLVEAHAREVDSFRRGAALLQTPPEVVAIPYGARSLPGYLFRPAGAGDAPLPTMVLVNGYDGTAEELYFTNGAAALARGYNVITFDGPGQGSMIIDEGVPFRPDWENVVTPVLDWALRRPEVDPDRIVLMGLSFGGYLAPRAAAREHRIAACVSDCGPYDLYAASVSRVPAVLARHLPDGNASMLGILARLLSRVMARPTAGWALRRNLLVHGLDDPLEYFRMASQYSLDGIAGDITCPTFVCCAEADDLSALAPTFYDALTCPKEFVRFATADGAGAHCESGARTLFHQRVFDWLDDVLAADRTPGLA